MNHEPLSVTHYQLPIINYPLPFDRYCMYSSNSVLRRYTPPTCTLEIFAKGSPLSRWFDRPLLKQLKFQLNFDDPRMPEEKRATVKGNKTQLDLLCEVVQVYVQEFLDRSAEELDESSLSLELGDRSELSDNNTEPFNGFADPSTATLEMPRFQPAEVESLESDRSSHLPETDSNSTHTPNFLSSAEESQENSAAVLPTPSTEIYLQPKGLLSHNLYLGSLANNDSGPFIHLSLLQLFDLATALDEYASDVEILPNLARPAPKPSTIWAGIAAMLVVTVGVTTAVVKVADRKTTRQETVASTANSEVKPNEQQPIAIAPSPEASVGVPAAPATSPQTLPSLPPSAASVTPNPSATPSGGIAPSPSPGATPPVGSGASPSPGASPNPTSTSTPSPADNYKLPLNSAASPAKNSSQTPPQNSRDNRSVVQIIPSQTTQSQQVQQQPKPKQPPSVAPPPLPAPRSMDVPPPLKPPSGNSQNVPPPTTQIASQPPQPRQTRPSSKPNPSPSAGASPTSLPTPLASANIPSTTPKPQETSQTPANSAGEAISQSSSGLDNNSSAETPLAARSRATATQPNPISSPAAERNNATLFDTIPQVAEARDYFQNRWRPPSNLSRPLEYSLRLNSDGSIRQILPLGQVAEVYLDRTEMPLLGETFVSPVEGKRNPKIRVILNPDGKVQTHLESLD